jgi:transposase
LGGQRVAQGLRDGEAAVNAGMTRSGRTGPVEGVMKRRTMRKRQLCGRARLDRLSRRFRLAPRRVQRPEPRPQELAEA